MSRFRMLSDRQVRELRQELERERERFGPHDPRHYAAALALERMDLGTYGQCEDCGEGIPFTRLAVLPETRHCVSCGARVPVS